MTIETEVEVQEDLEDLATGLHGVIATRLAGFIFAYTN